MGAPDLSQYLWPDAELGRQPQGVIKCAIAGALACSAAVGTDSIAASSDVGSPARVVRHDGIATQFSGTERVSVAYPGGASAYTLICLARLEHAPSVRQLLDDDDVASNRVFQLRQNNYGIDFIPFDASGSPVTISLSTGPITNLENLSLVIARSGGGKAALDVNTLGSASTTMSSHKPLSGVTIVGNFKYGYTSPNPDGIYGYVIIDRYISDIEVSNIFAVSPWQLFKAPLDIGWPAIAGGGATLNGSASGASQASGAANLSAQVALASIGIANTSGTAALTTSIPLSAAGLAVSTSTAGASATVTISAAGLASAAGVAGISASVLLAGAGAATAAGNASLAAQLQAMASGAAQATGTATLSGGAIGDIAASGIAVASATAALHVTVSLQAAGAAVASGSASGQASSPGSISAAGTSQAAGSAVMTASVSITAAGFVQAMGNGAIAVNIPLSAFGSASASGGGYLSISDGSIVLVRAPAGAGPTLINRATRRPPSAISSRPRNSSGRRY